jgi:hypothetical protein
MSRAFLLVSLAALLVMAAPVSGAVFLTANASPAVAHIGDVITINGTIGGSPTIVVFLFVTGPGLDPRGVTLDNLNIPAGRGMFTTAPVEMSDGSWTYTWDTSVTLGTLTPGKYTVYVVDAPVNRKRFVKETFATTEIEFLPSDRSMTETPLDPFLPVLGLGIAVIASLFLAGRSQKKD